MVRQDNTNEDLSQAGSFFPDLDALYESVMDDALGAQGPSRTIRLHLTPILSAPSGTAPVNPVAANFNPFMDEAIRTSAVERYAGAHKEARYAEYKANIRHGPAELVQGTPIGRLDANEVQTTTVIEARQHILNCMSMEVDGKRYKLSKGPRPIGWQAAKYVMTVWTEIENESAGAE